MWFGDFSGRPASRRFWRYSGPNLGLVLANVGDRLFSTFIVRYNAPRTRQGWENYVGKADRCSGYLGGPAATYATLIDYQDIGKRKLRSIPTDRPTFSFPICRWLFVNNWFSPPRESMIGNSDVSIPRFTFSLSLPTLFTRQINTYTHTHTINYCTWFYFSLFTDNPTTLVDDSRALTIHYQIYQSKRPSGELTIRNCHRLCQRRLNDRNFYAPINVMHSWRTSHRIYLEYRKVLSRTGLASRDREDPFCAKGLCLRLRVVFFGGMAHESAVCVETRVDLT